MTALSDGLTFDRGPAMANRVMLAPLTNFQSHDDGTLSDDEQHWLVKRAEGGFGLTMTCAAHVQESGKAFPGQLGIWSDAHIAGLTRLADAIHTHGSTSSVQIHHGGERAVRELNGGELLAPWDGGEFGARALTTDEVKAARDAYVAAAVRAEKAGFHGVELHGAHGYLLCEFLDVAQNQREDGYGSDYAGRTRLIREIIDGVRASTGKDFQLGLRLSPERFGIDTAEALQFAQELMTGGALDYLDMSLWDTFKEPIDERYKGKPLVDWFAALERGSCRLGVAGKLTSAARAQEALDHGADFVLIGRGAILHHDWPRRAVADAGFVATPLPVSRAYLKAEGLGPAFVDYMATGWPNFVSDR